MKDKFNHEKPKTLPTQQSGKKTTPLLKEPIEYALARELGRLVGQQLVTKEQALKQNQKESGSVAPTTAPGLNP